MAGLTEDGQDKKSEAGNKSGSTATKVVFGIVLIALVCGGLFFIKQAHATAAAPSSTITYTYDLGEILTNLSDTSDMKYIKTSIVLVTSDKTVETEIKNNEPQLRDCLISLFNSETGEDFLNNRVKIKDLSMDSLNKDLTSGKVTNIYFSDLVMQ